MTRRRRFATALAATALAAAGFLLVFHPSRPLWIRHVDLPVVAAADGIRLAGTLSLPRWRTAPHPVVVIVHGSGRSVRADMIPEVRRFVERGFAVYTYDKRGVGESSGTFAEPSSRHSTVLQDLAQHARAVYEAVCQRPEIDRTRAGFFGVSQAGWIIPLAANAATPPARFAVILSGPAVSTGIEERYSELTADGRNPQALSQMPAIRAEIDAYRGPSGYDPRSTLEQFLRRTPSLWILGEQDLSVPTWATVRVLRELTARDRMPPLTLVTYPGAGHDLRQADGRPNPAIWDDIDRFLAPVAR